MLKKLEIINGEMTLEFDSLVNTYTVNVENDVTKLLINYECENPNCRVEILQNDFLLEGRNEVEINVYGENEFSSYILVVTREKTSSAFHEENIENLVNIEGNTVEFENYAVEYLIVVCVVLIIIFYRILFPKKKTKN
ncbi:MAG: hypothetical protein R3Y13_04085 [bacterium]